jgi:NitT/TauT family transport system ATP-binding protein
MTIEPAIVLDRVSVRFESDSSKVSAVEDVGFSVAQNEFVALIGPSGCGKTTLLKLVSGLLKPSGGAVTVCGFRAAEARRKRLCGLVFQEPALLPWRTVEGNIRLVAEIVGCRADVQGLMELVGLNGFERNLPHELSGGMQQRVGLCRALAFDPPILLMDEPFAALDLLTRETLSAELLRIWETRRKTVLFVTHSIPEAVLLADRVVVLSPRPARIVGVIPVDLPRPRSAEVENSRTYSELVGEVKAALRKTQGMVR